MSLKRLTLLIDDNNLDRFIHKKLLLHYKITEQVLEFEGGRDALNYLNNINKDEQLPDLILLDLMMPEMNGFQFLKHYQQIHKTLKTPPLLFMLSSTEDEKDLQKARKNDLILKLLHKPLLPESLIKNIKTHS